MTLPPLPFTDLVVRQLLAGTPLSAPSAIRVADRVPVASGLLPMVQVREAVSPSVRSVLSEVIRISVGGESTVMEASADLASGLDILTSTVY